MKSNENNVKRIFDKQPKQWFEVTPEQYEEFDRWRTNLRKREQYHKRCMCPRNKWWLCDGMCDDCEFHAAGDVLSLDKTVSNDDGDETRLLDSIPSSTSNLNDIILDQILMQQLLKRLDELMPEAREIGRLRQMNIKDEDIADAIGIKRTTFRSRIEKARDQLSEEFSVDFPF